MHKLRLVTVSAILALLVSSVLVSAAQNNTTAAAKPAVKAAPAKAAPAKAAPAKAASFDQEAAMSKFKNAPDSTVIATVNGQAITKGELVKALWDWNAPATLDELINQKMIDQAAKKAGVTIAKEDMDKKVEETKQRMPGEFSEVLRRYNLTKSRFMSGTKTSLLAEKAVEKQLKVTDGEIAEYVKASHVLIRFPQGEADKAKGEQQALEKAQKVLAEIKGGKDFAAAAKEYSEDPSNKDKGGDLSWFKKGRMVKEFEDKAFAMKPGEMSEPVKTFYGYHIIRLDKLGKDATKEEKAQLSKDILEQQKPQELQKWYTNLKASAKIDNKINPPLPPQPAPMGMPAGHPE